MCKAIILTKCGWLNVKSRTGPTCLQVTIKGNYDKKLKYKIIVLYKLELKCLIPLIIY